MIHSRATVAPSLVGESGSPFNRMTISLLSGRAASSMRRSTPTFSSRPVGFSPQLGSDWFTTRPSTLT